MTVVSHRKRKAEPKWRPLYTAMINEIEQVQSRVKHDYLWGCFLLAQCKPLVEIGRPAYDRLAARYSEDFHQKLKAMQHAASFLVLTKHGTGEHAIRDAGTKAQGKHVEVDGKNRPR